MNDLNKHFNESDFEAEEVFAEDPFDAEFRRREDEEAEEADRVIDDDETGDFDVEN
jgi:hypothetical protein